ncbi:MAG: helix-turn-helix transcriptional regulator, partial [Oscillospiraceae bacterium]|nr:helix-turn-helix transcriptional regulator [Oscillospiraceae bacterium]
MPPVQEGGESVSLEELRERNIQLVTEKAVECFVERGIENTRVSDIAKAAGLTERSVYRYFPKKSDLF